MPAARMAFNIREAQMDKVSCVVGVQLGPGSQLPSPSLPNFPPDMCHVCRPPVRSCKRSWRLSLGSWTTLRAR